MIGGSCILHVACDVPGCKTRGVFYGGDEEAAHASAERAVWRIWIGNALCACPEHTAIGILDLLEKIAAAAVTRVMSVAAVPR